MKNFIFKALIVFTVCSTGSLANSVVAEESLKLDIGAGSVLDLDKHAYPYKFLLDVFGRTVVSCGMNNDSEFAAYSMHVLAAPLSIGSMQLKPYDIVFMYKDSKGKGTAAFTNNLLILKNVNSAGGEQVRIVECRGNDAFLYAKTKYMKFYSKLAAKETLTDELDKIERLLAHNKSIANSIQIESNDYSKRYGATISFKPHGGTSKAKHTKIMSEWFVNRNHQLSDLFDLGADNIAKISSAEGGRGHYLADLLLHINEDGNIAEVGSPYHHRMYSRELVAELNKNVNPVFMSPDVLVPTKIYLNVTRLEGSGYKITAEVYEAMRPARLKGMFDLYLQHLNGSIEGLESSKLALQADEVRKLAVSFQNKPYQFVDNELYGDLVIDNHCARKSSAKKSTVDLRGVRAVDVCNYTDAIRSSIQNDFRDKIKRDRTAFATSINSSGYFGFISKFSDDGEAWNYKVVHTPFNGKLYAVSVERRFCSPSESKWIDPIFEKQLIAKYGKPTKRVTLYDQKVGFFAGMKSVADTLAPLARHSTYEVRKQTSEIQHGAPVVRDMYGKSGISALDKKKLISMAWNYLDKSTVEIEAEADDADTSCGVNKKYTMKITSGNPDEYLGQINMMKENQRQKKELIRYQNQPKL